MDADAVPGDQARVRLYLLAALAISLLVKVTLAARNAELPLLWDQVRYYAAARALAEHRLDPAAFPGTFLTPGYPYVLAFVMLLAGPQPLSLMLGQAVVSTLAAGLLYLLGRDIFGARAGLLAAAIFALLPELVGLTHLLYSETVLLPFLIGSFALILRHHRTGSMAAACGAGLLWGLGTLVKPAYVWFPLAAGGVMVLVDRRRARLPRRIAAAVLLLAGFFAALAPWLARNYAVTGRFPVLTTNRWVNLWVGNKDRGTRVFDRYNAISDETEREELARREAMAWIRAQGAMWLPVKLHRNVPGLFGAGSFTLRQIWIGEYGTLPLGTVRAVILVSIGAYLATMLLAIPGFVAAPWEPFKAYAVAFVVPAVAFHVVMEALTRYREPLMIVAILYAGYSATRPAAELRAALRRKLAWLLLLAFAYAVAFAPDNVGVRELWQGRSRFAGTRIEGGRLLMP